MRLKSSVLLMLVLVLALVLASAAASGCRRSGRSMGLASASPDAIGSAGARFQLGSFRTEGGTPASPQPAVKEPEDLPRPIALDSTRKLIRNGEISIEVRDFEAAARRAEKVSSSLGGYVADSQVSGEGPSRRGTFAIRVPAGSFDAALSELRALGKVQAEHVGIRDATKAYTDLEARLSVKRDAAERIRAILRERAGRLGDVLQAEKQLSEFVEQIEVMEGEKRFYDQQVALSTISADIHEPEALTRPSALAPLRQALKNSIYHLSASLAAFVTGALYVLPWMLTAVALFPLWRRLRRRAVHAAA
jgi:hypothetical protein